MVRHAVSLLVSAAFTDGTVRSSLLQQSNFKPWLQQLVLLAKEVKFRFRLVLSEENTDSKKETVYDVYSFFGISCLFPFLSVPETLKRIARSEPGNIFRASLTRLAFFTPPAIHSSSYNVAKGHVKVRIWSVESITVIPSRSVMHFSESVRFHYLTQIN